jgi:predicted nucleotide-binding protein
MGNREAIEALNRLLGQIPVLRKLEYGNKEYDLWYYEVVDTLDNFFGIGSVEYRRFIEKWRSWDSNASEAQKQQRYLKTLEEHETDLISIIKRLEIRKPPIINRLETFASEISTYQHLQRRSYRGVQSSLTDKKHKENMRLAALGDLGVLRDLITEVTGKDEVIVIPKSGQKYSYDVWLRGLGDKFDARADDALSKGLDLITVTIGRLEDDINKGVRDEEGRIVEKLQRVETKPPKAFISHGKESAALRKLKEFLETLGIEPLIVKKRPSLDKDLPDKVNLYLNQADFVIVLATGDDKVGDKLQPRQNVIHEIGLAQKTHAGKIIYLLEDGAEFPSNIRPKVWESFKQRNMMDAFLSIVRELREYGMLKAVKP